jgi:Fur family transcriptional regulator, ferric uptake regulator
MDFVQIASEFRKVLRQEQLKFTPQRLAVLKEVVDGQGHRECEDIYFSLRNDKIPVSRATVYRTMDILVKHNYVRKLDIGDGRSRYESKLSEEHHDHLICIHCGNIEEFFNESIEKLQVEITEKFSFKMVRHTHQIFGICRKCQNDIS